LLAVSHDLVAAQLERCLHLAWRSLEDVYPEQPLLVVVLISQGMLGPHPAALRVGVVFLAHSVGEFVGALFHQTARPGFP